MRKILFLIFIVILSVPVFSQNRLQLKELKNYQGTNTTEIVSRTLKERKEYMNSVSMQNGNDYISGQKTQIKHYLQGNNDSKYVGNVLFESDFSNNSQWGVDQGAGTSANWTSTTTGPGLTGFPDFASTTASNGYAMFNSSYYCGQDQEAYLITQQYINCSNATNVHLKFESLYARYFNDVCVYLEWGQGDGEYAFIELYGNYNNNDLSPNPTYFDLNVSEYLDGKPQVRIGFYYLSRETTHGEEAGCGYAWMVDDLTLYEWVEPPYDDIGVFAKTLYKAVPLNQSPSFTIVSHIYNYGRTITNSFNTSVQGAVTSSAQVPVPFSHNGDQYITFNTPFVTNTMGVHEFEVSSELAGDIDTDDNTDNIEVFVNGGMLSRLFNDPMNGNMSIGGSNYGYIAQAYNITNNAKMVAVEFTFISKTMQGLRIDIFDDNNGVPGSVVATTGNFNITASDLSSDETTAITKNLQTELNVRAGQRYYIAVYEPTNVNGVQVIYSLKNYFPGESFISMDGGIWETPEEMNNFKFTYFISAIIESSNEQPQLTVTPLSWSAGNVAIGSNSTSGQFIVKNSGTGTLTVSHSSLPLPWTTNLPAEVTLGANEERTFTFGFIPTSLGESTQSFIIEGDNEESKTINLSGTGVQPIPEATLTPTTWDTGNVLLGDNRTSSNFTLKNTGSGTLTVTNVTVLSAPWYTSFTPSMASQISLNSGQEYNFTFTFVPTSLGESIQSFIITTNAGVKVVTLTGNGVNADSPISTVNPTSWNAGQLNVGSETVSRQFTLKNTGGGQLTVSNVTSLNTPWSTSMTPEEISEILLNANGEYNFTISFNPSTVGNYSREFVITTNGGTVRINIEANVQDLPPTATLTPNSWNAGNVMIGRNKISGSFTLKNTGGNELTISNVTSLSGAWTSTLTPSVISTISLEAGEEHPFTFTFTPTTVGNSNISFEITTNAGVKTVSLSGVGIEEGPELTLTPTTTWDAGTVYIGQNKRSESFTIKNTGVGTISDITVTALNSPWSTTFTLSVAEALSLSAGDEYTFTFTFTPVAEGNVDLSFIINTSGAGNKIISLYGKGETKVDVPVFNEDQINIYPNPSTGIINIEVAQRSTVKIVDMTGRLIETFVVNPDAASNLTLATGMYFVQVENNGKIITRKVVIE